MRSIEAIVNDIKEAVAAHEANHHAVKVAKLPEGFEGTVVEAMRTSLKDQLVKIFQKTIL